MSAYQNLQPYEVILAQEPVFRNLATDLKVNWDKESLFAMQQLEKNLTLVEYARENPQSLADSVNNLATIGLSLNPAEKQAYLVPRKLKGKAMVCLDISYQGLLDLAVQSGSILWAKADLIHANDTFKVQIGSVPIHEYEFYPESARGEIVGVYCLVKTPDGAYLTTTMYSQEIDVIRGKAMTKKVWDEFPKEMTKKACIKNASKTWPNHGLMAKASAILNDHEGIDFDAMHDVTPPKSKSETVSALLAPSGENIEVEDLILAANDRASFQKAKDAVMAVHDAVELSRLKKLFLRMQAEHKQQIEEAANV